MVFYWIIIIELSQRLQWKTNKLDKYNKLHSFNYIYYSNYDFRKPFLNAKYKLFKYSGSQLMWQTESDNINRISYWYNSLDKQLFETWSIWVNLITLSAITLCDFHCTIQTMYNDHTWDSKKWPLFRGGCYSEGACKELVLFLDWRDCHCWQVIMVQRWLLK
jgi:hypothetical protein